MVATRRTKKMHPLLKWLRAAGAGSALLGFGSLMLGDRFWFGVILTYLGLFALAIDVWFEPEFHGKWGRKASAWALIALLAGLFTYQFVAVSAPLDLSALMINGAYPPGTSIHGIDWRPEFTEEDVDFVNNTDDPYSQLNIVIRPTNAIAAISQDTSIPDVNFQDASGEALKLLNGTGISVPLVLIATDAGYRLRCPNLPPHSDIKIVLAIVDIKWNPQPNPTADDPATNRSYILKIHRDDFSSYWYGYKDGDVYATRPTSSEFIKVEGTYVAMHRERNISEKLPVGGLMRQ